MTITRVITDRDVLLGKVVSPIVLDGATLLTPAARDRAVQKGLVIVERDGGSAPDPRSAAGSPRPAGSAEVVASSPASHGAAVLGELPDGLYLVRVEGGQTVSFAPATGPGLMTPRARP